MTTVAAAPTIVSLSNDRIAAAAAALARAFHGDPLQTHVFPDADERARRSPAHFEALLRYGLKFGEVFTTANETAGAAVWLPPDGWEVTPERAAGSGLDRLGDLIGQAPATRFLEAIGFIEPFHHRDMSDPHWYTMVVGVDPLFQGRGIGRALLAPILSRADAEAMPCYLETAQPRNVAFYQHLGFRVVVNAVEPTSGLPMWTFRRDPHVYS